MGYCEILVGGMDQFIFSSLYGSRMGSGRTPDGLETVDLEGVGRMFEKGLIKKIGFLTGAGVSVSAGIPDFRSPGGMYDTLRPDLLTASEDERNLMSADPTAVVSWDIFSKNQFPYLELRRPFILGTSENKWKATLSHYFVRVCHDKDVLCRWYSQNIDGLDFQTNVPNDKIVCVHGSLGTVQCDFCKAPYPTQAFQDQLRSNVKDIYNVDPTAPKESKNIPCLKCNKNGVKPSTVLYGSSLPPEFFSYSKIDKNDIDLLIIAGTSLVVFPANTLVNEVREDCVRIVINNEKVGEDLGINYGADSKRDIFIEGTCDSGFLALARTFGWGGDLKKYQDLMASDSSKLLSG